MIEHEGDWIFLFRFIVVISLCSYAVWRWANELKLALRWTRGSLSTVPIARGAVEHEEDWIFLFRFIIVLSFLYFLRHLGIGTHRGAIEVNVEATRIYNTDLMNHFRSKTPSKNRS